MYLKINFPFRTDTQKELELIKQAAVNNGAFDAVVCTHWADGGEGATALADAVINACNKPSNFKFLYDLQLPLEEKMSVIAKEMYGASKVVLTPEVQETLERYSKQVCFRNEFLVLFTT